jgi:hypothetical protein
MYASLLGLSDALHLDAFDQPAQQLFFVTMKSGPCGSRTHDQRIKSPLLYRTELTALIVNFLYSIS